MPPRNEAEEERDNPPVESTMPPRNEAEEERDHPLPLTADAKRIAAAQAYIDALVTHDGGSVPFASDCTRVEQGLKNGFSGKHLRRSLSRGPQYRIIAATTAPHFTVAGDDVRARYTVLTRFALAGRRAAAHVDETFVVDGDGRIRHIRVRFAPTIVRRQ